MECERCLDGNEPLDADAKMVDRRARTVLPTLDISGGSCTAASAFTSSANVC
jgi:hypothetical protein